MENNSTENKKEESKPHFTTREENAIWGVIQYLSKEQYKNPTKIFRRDDVMQMIYDELD